MADDILVVDDDEMNLLLVEHMLIASGYAVRKASSARAALDEISRSPPRIILMDLHMPGMDGLELTRHLKANMATRGIAIIALTAHAMKGVDEQARAAGCDAYLTKPIDRQLLRRVVKLHMDTGSH